ncbi:hypothetical protein I79_008066 [Cricetulus griseus]|uniref:Uncharacterized protein n=1 Tax=Cricetulus griseus TaxID=10029 RepID=G3HC23_CRIGR|nr:hypothetical protein I79_008066 [Cricetulus griseus]
MRSTKPNRRRLLRPSPCRSLCLRFLRRPKHPFATPLAARAMTQARRRHFSRSRCTGGPGSHFVLDTKRELAAPAVVAQTKGRKGQAWRAGGRPARYATHDE